MSSWYNVLEAARSRYTGFITAICPSVAPAILNSTRGKHPEDRQDADCATDPLSATDERPRQTVVRRALALHPLSVRYQPSKALDRQIVDDGNIFISLSISGMFNVGSA